MRTPLASTCEEPSFGVRVCRAFWERGAGFSSGTRIRRAVCSRSLSYFVERVRIVMELSEEQFSELAKRVADELASRSIEDPSGGERSRRVYACVEGMLKLMGPVNCPYYRGVLTSECPTGSAIKAKFPVPGQVKKGQYFFLYLLS